MTFPRNILLFHQAALGDFIVTWPLALGLARVMAQSRIFYVTSGEKGALAERALRVESVDVEGGWHHLFSQEPHVPVPASRLLHGAQWIISFVSGPQDLWAQNVSKLAAQAKLVTLSTVPPEDFKGHITEYLLAQLRPWPILSAAMEQMLKSVASRGISSIQERRGPIVIHPGSGSGKKCWPAERFLELARLLSKSGRAVKVILGEVELEQWPKERIEQFARIAQLRQTASVVELMETISSASTFIGNDSGPGHLAGILGVPTVSIFGPKDPTRWKPLGPQVRIVQGEWDAITAASILEMLQSAS